MWFNIIMAMLAVLGAWENLRKILCWALAVPGRMGRYLGRVFTCGVPLTIQLAEAADDLGFILARRWRNPLHYPRRFTAGNVPLTTWLAHPARAVDSYQRHLRALRENDDWLRATGSRAASA